MVRYLPAGQRAELDEALEEAGKPPEKQAPPLKIRGASPPPWFKQGKAGAATSIKAGQELGLQG